MTQAQSKSYGGVKKKLMGAICMLLVASIMVVSSTYAWFTLSTAPEITGISTSVGANGNLEMALLPTDGDLSKITSAVGDSSAAANKKLTESNLTWGNLVDLSAEDEFNKNAYGLDQIKLMPARANIEGDGTHGYTLNLTASPLKTASYGADGRVVDVSGATQTASKGTDGKFTPAAEIAYGVRAVGASSDTSPRQIDFINAKANYQANHSDSKDFANMKARLGNEQNLMALLALKQATDTDTVDQDKITLIKGLLNDLNMDLDTIVEAYRYLIIAEAANKTDVSDEAYSLLKAAVDTPKTLNDLVAATQNVQNAYTAQLSAIKTAKENIQTSLTAVDNLRADTSTKSELMAAVETALGKLDSSSFVADGSNYYWGAGALQTAADSVGTKLLVNAHLAIIYAGAKDTAGVLPSLGGWTNTGDSNTVNAITDFYGYILDMAFRTNASSSKLQLQTEAVNRVYSDSQDSNSAIQGSGSKMTFKKSDTTLQGESLQKLMEAIRVAFVANDTSNKLLGIASLDGIAAVAGENAEGAYSGTLTLKDFSLDENGVLKLNQKAEGDGKDDLAELTQNQATKISVVVWLDGDIVDNSMVGNAATSITGSMNLQFSSSATLTPMENSALRNMQKTNNP